MPRMLRLSLEVELGSEPIRGSLARDEGERRTFQGWMELAATLEALTEVSAAGLDDDGARGQAPS